MRATWQGEVVAESDDVQVVDGYTYFPLDAVDDRYLRPSCHRSTCPWKGTASYFDVIVGDAVNARAAWTYPQPSVRAAARVGGRIAFWRGVKVERDADTDEEPGGRLRRMLTRRA